MCVRVCLCVRARTLVRGYKFIICKNVMPLSPKSMPPTSACACARNRAGLLDYNRARLFDFKKLQSACCAPGNRPYKSDYPSIIIIIITISRCLGPGECLHSLE